MRRIISGLFSALLFIGMLTLAFNIQPVEASGTIYIRADGSIEPDTAPISSVDNITYTFTDNIYDSIVVERDNIVVDGAGYTVQGTGSGTGIDLNGRKNVTIKNMQIKAFEYGIGHYFSNNTVSGNSITNNIYGVYLHGSSSNNTISGNNITDNDQAGVHIYQSSSNTVSGNSITNNSYGVWLSRSSSNTISGNTFVDGGLYFYSLDFHNPYGNLVENNTVNGKPLVYLENISGYTVEDAGQIILINCTNITVKNFNLSNTDIGVQLLKTNSTKITNNNITNNYRGICLQYSSSNNTISGNSITNNFDGVYLHGSSSNTVSGNNITNNSYGVWLHNSSNNSVFGNNITNSVSGRGISLLESSSNTIYHNNFIDNAQQVYFYESGYANVWDDGYPSGGNYWSDYIGVDLYSGPYQNETGGDGIGDTPYIIDADNRDNYPSMNPWAPGWKLDFVGSTKHPIVDFAVYNGSLYAAGDNKLYVKDGSSWNVIDAPTFVTSLETVNMTYQQPAPIEWSHTYGGTDMDYAYDMIQTSDGGYALVGSTWSYGAGIDDFWLVKTDVAGNMEWNHTYGGTGTDTAYALVQTTDGGYALAGYTSSFGAGSWDLWLVKTDASGNMEWNQTYGGIHADRAFDLVQTIDGGYAIAGDTESYGSDIGDHYDAWLVKTDAGGNVLWNRTYGGGAHDSAHALVQTTDGGYALAGQQLSIWPGGFWIVKTDAAGDEQWNRTYGGTVYNQEWANGIVQTSDGGYAVIGATRSFGAGQEDFWLVKTDIDGAMQWNKTYGGASTDIGYDLVQTSDCGYALTGYTFSLGAGHDFWLVKTDANGAMQWNQTYGGTYDEFAQALVQAADGGYVMAGYTYSYGAGSHDFWLVKTEPYDDSKERLVVGGQGGLYCYDGTSFDLVFSIPTYIKALGICNDTLYAGTMLDNPPKLYYCNGSADNPIDWHIDADFSAILSFSGAFGSIDSFGVYDNVMYVGSGGTLYSFNGTDWSVATSYDDVSAFLDMQVYNGKLYLATRDHGWRKPIYQGGTGFSGRVIQYDGENWTTIFEHDYWIYSLGIYDDKLHAGTANAIFTYNGATWENSFNATEGAYYALCFENYDDKIYVGMGNGYIFADPAETASPQTPMVPEFPSFIILLLFMIATLLAVIVYRRKTVSDCTG